MKRFSGVLLALAVLAASCSSDPPTAPADDTHPQFKATLLPANEVPAIVGAETVGSGVATIDFTLVKDSAGAITAGPRTSVLMSPDSRRRRQSRLAHIHPGAAGVSGGVLVERGRRPGEVVLTNGAVTFSRLNITMTAVNARQIVNNPPGYYFNVHTEANPGGVMRGQLVKQ